ncbi:hypothetical protein IQ269_04720 [Tychonema sp. LEGE 07199]|uniref:hypothetical protein n=1 Tax=unclassified Tychonema TaxID=2642144 RepID=UPI0018809550|nr:MULTISPECIES: hypothetical protein [unclassified Tychonema]MBE9120125.1 hypothetical protein [Tychonema sp. LEGE 07199]MBE9132869.1 hypothetical protein [Tychonema sp. LEGE 07196]
MGVSNYRQIVNAIFKLAVIRYPVTIAIAHNRLDFSVFRSSPNTASFLKQQTKVSMLSFSPGCQQLQISPNVQDDYSELFSL